MHEHPLAEKRCSKNEPVYYIVGNLKFLFTQLENLKNIFLEQLYFAMALEACLVPQGGSKLRNLAVS